MKNMGWEITVDFEHSLKKTVEWMTDEKHKHWLYDVVNFVPEEIK
jgi:dTDP-D-glucose 4,6-dehydratase